MESDRSEAVDEIFNTIELLQGYDAQSRAIRNWSLLVGTAAILVGLALYSAPAFLLAALLSAGFWIIQARLKLQDLTRVRRAREQIAALGPGDDVSSPAEMLGGAKRTAEDRTRLRWLGVSARRDVLLPHVAFVVVDLAMAVRLLLAGS